MAQDAASDRPSADQCLFVRLRSSDASGHADCRFASTNDWVLAIIARLHTLISTKLSFGVAGLQAVNVGHGADGTPVVENIDLSDILNGHLELAPKMAQVLAKIGMEQ